MQKLYTLACLAMLCASVAQGGTDYRIMFQSGALTPPENHGEFVSAAEAGEIVGGYYYRLLQFYSVPTVAQKEALAQTGVILLDYMPHLTFVAAFPAGYKGSQLSQHSVRAIYKMESYQKINRNLRDEVPAHARIQKGSIDLKVQVYSNLSETAILALAAAEGSVLRYTALTHVLELRIPESRLVQLASLPWVWYIESVSPPSIHDDTEGRSLHRSNVINTDQPMGRHYNGAGVAVALSDDGFVGPHIDFTGRIVNHATTVGNTHGDMTGGILGGAGNLDPTVRGMADGVQLHVFQQDNTNYYQIVDAVSYNSLYGTVVSSTSYSQGCNEYTSDTQFGDQTTRDNPQLLFVFSAGNNGTGLTFGDCGYGAGLPWGTITGGYKQGKNVLAVANLDALEVLDNTSSRGPASDGRIKPEISSNGRDQRSTDEGNTYQIGGGTSAACPGIAGISAQLIQAYKSLNTATNAPTALIKAALMNSAEDIGNAGPDFTYGYGRVNALRAVQVLENNTYLLDSVTQGNTNTHVINVPANVARVKVMVYWHDEGGNPASSTMLINDLDMTVTDPSLTAWNPWVLDATPVVASLTAPATRGTDHLNNIEQVTLDNPAAGAYSVAVNGYAVPGGVQLYYLVYEFVYDDITVTYPIGGEGFVPGSTEVIRWDALRSGGTFSLDYSTDSGTTWNPITSGISASTQQYVWSVPATLTDDAVVRVSRGAVTGSNSAPFAIIGTPLNIVYNWCCPDSIKLSWTSVTGATGYEISMLGASYMDSVGTSATTSFVMHNVIPTNTYWFSVRALLPNGKGQRTLAKVKNPGLFSCPLAIDADILQLLSPASGSLQDCQNLAVIPVKINIGNVGANVLTNIPVKYTLNGGPVVSEVFTGTLNAGQNAVFTFASTVDLSVLGAYNLNVWIELPGDMNIYNDSDAAASTVISGVLGPFPFTENFESFTTCSNASTCEATSCATANGWYQEVNLVSDDIDFRPHQGATPSGSTGPDVDHTFGTTAGHYVYLEASQCSDKEADLVSPCISLAGVPTPELSFWYHLYGGNMGVLHVDLFVNGEWILDITPPLTGNQGNTWRNRSVSLVPWSGQVINIRFRGVTGDDYDSDMAIDDIRVDFMTGLEELASNDISVFPNPSRGQFQVSVAKAGTYTVDITGPDGRLVKSLQMNAGHSELEVDLGDCASGIYTVAIRGKETVYKRIAIL